MEELREDRDEGMTTERWQAHFATPTRAAVRPARGETDIAHIIEVDDEGPRIAVWRPGRDPEPTRHIDGDLLTSLPTVDGLGVLRVRDSGGDELGHVWCADLTDATDIDLTPDLPAYTLRGIDTTADGTLAALTMAGAGGYSLVLATIDGSSAPRLLFTSPNETWNGRISPDGSLASVDTTDHNPGVRRFAVTAFDVASGKQLDTLFDPPAGTARAIRWSRVPGDNRVLVASERTGYTRPTVWNPRTGERVDLEVADRAGEVMPIDWSPDASTILAVHIDEGLHRLLEIDVESGEVRSVDHPDGSVFQPDIGSPQIFVFTSYYAPDGALRVVRERANMPMGVWDRGAPEVDALLPPTPSADGQPFSSVLVTAQDDVTSQLWFATPTPGRPAPTILEVHGGPTYVTTEQFHPSAQAWLDSGFAFASLNYRGSVTFGREFRESFIGAVGRGQLFDIDAAVGHLIEAGVADAHGLFITGSSYGGYLTLLSLARRPDLFRGGFAYVAMADWAIAYEDSNPALRSASEWIFGGSPEEVPSAYRDASVTTYVDDIRSPVWISQGTADTRTPMRQIEVFVNALRERGGDVILEVFDGGHSATATEAAVAAQRTMLSLAHRALRGERWSDQVRPRRST